MSPRVWVVTGGAGFIGSNLVEALLCRGERVRALDDFSSGRRSNLAAVDDWARTGGAEFELIEGDVRDADLCRRLVDGASFVLHQAAIPSVPRSVEDPLTSHDVNVDGTLQLLEAARHARIGRFVFASSSSIYGESETLPKVETMPPDPISPYGLQKLTAESYCGLYWRLYGLPTVSLRYFNIFGPRQDPASDYAAVVPRFLTAVDRGRRPTVYGDGEQTRDFTYVANAVAANLGACEAKPVAFGRTYNVGAGRRTSLNALLAEIGRLVGRDIDPIYEPARAGDILHSLAAIERAQSDLGYRVTVDLAEGLRRTRESL